ncbi:conserved hypothetical protein [Ricinus communis]|uniref:Uncharacterized protein n=1 Tax=Ricinus communis TaxID=3988 RepID=B9SMC7_RICCO|nr:conserved hypothetical protein [Ricinus communis]
MAKKNNKAMTRTTSQFQDEVEENKESNSQRFEEMRMENLKISQAIEKQIAEMRDLFRSLNRQGFSPTPLPTIEPPGLNIPHIFPTNTNPIVTSTQLVTLQMPLTNTTSPHIPSTGITTTQFPPTTISSPVIPIQPTSYITPQLSFSNLDNRGLLPLSRNSVEISSLPQQPCKLFTGSGLNFRMELPHFDGGNARSWTCKCAKLFHIYNIANEQKVELAILFLGEKADN